MKSCRTECGCDAETEETYDSIKYVDSVNVHDRRQCCGGLDFEEGVCADKRAKEFYEAEAAKAKFRTGPWVPRWSKQQTEVVQQMMEKKAEEERRVIENRASKH